MDNEQGVYPSGIRQNGFYNYYADISMENYYEAKECLQQLQEIDPLIRDYHPVERKLQRRVVTSVVFSAMCIESFLNDYAAACLGDKEFYDSFDMLSPEGKFTLICSFILKHKVDKSQLYYCRLKELIKARNEFVHNKSKEQFFEQSLAVPEDETDELEEKLLVESLIKYAEHTYQECQKDVVMARNGIEAIKEIALLFDRLDPAAYAISRVFRPNYMLGRFINCPHPIDKVLREFKIGMN